MMRMYSGNFPDKGPQKDCWGLGRDWWSRACGGFPQTGCLIHHKPWMCSTSHAGARATHTLRLHENISGWRRDFSLAQFQVPGGGAPATLLCPSSSVPSHTKSSGVGANNEEIGGAQAVSARARMRGKLPVQLVRLSSRQRRHRQQQQAQKSPLRAHGDESQFDQKLSQPRA